MYICVGTQMSLSPSGYIGRMNRKNLEIGVQRLYYVFWAASTLWTIFFLIFLIFLARYRDESLAVFGVGIVLPGVVMFAGRWIYRGFIPKD